MFVYVVFVNNGEEFAEDAEEWILGIYDTAEKAQKALTDYCQEYYGQFLFPVNTCYEFRYEEWQVK